jgi:hypothetical protein
MSSILVKKAEDSVVALLALVGYIVLLEARFVMTTFIFLVVLFKIKERRRW